MMDASLEQLWMGFSEKLRLFIRSRVSDHASAEDILQDVFVKMQSKIGQLHDASKLQGWLFLITRNAIIDHYRTRKESVEILDTMAAESELEANENENLMAAF